MQEPSNEIKEPPDWQNTREKGFFDRSRGVRFLITLLFILSLFFYLHLREVPVEILEINSVAPGYIVAQVDFQFYDEEAMVILKQEAVRDVGKIYNLSDKEIRQRRADFENSLVANQEWRSLVPSTSYEEMYKAGEGLEKVLQQMRFTDPRTLSKMQKLAVPANNYLVYTPADLNEPQPLPNSIWDYASQTAFADMTLQPAAENFIIQFFRNKDWKLEEDIPAQRSLRRLVQSQVPEKYTSVSAGSRIVDQGERVTARHVAMLQAMKEAMGDSRNLWHPLTLLGTLMLSLILSGIFLCYIYYYYTPIFLSNRNYFLLVTILVITILLSKAAEFFLINSHSHISDLIRYPLFVPFSAILTGSLLNPAVATFLSGFLTITMAIALAFDNQSFMIVNLAGAMVAVLSSRSLRRRKEIFIVCYKAWLACVGVIMALHLYHNDFSSTQTFSDLLSSGIFMLLTAVLVVGILPLLESLFRIMTNVSLIEYMDPNNDLLRRLSIEAPGTYQHSVIVGNLSEAAAIRIGANGLFCRVAALYHDIGKIATPQYFTENQANGMNIHQLLTPKESAHVIIAHVSEGVAMARKAGLPEQFVDIIKEHHGTTLVYFFYRKQLEKMGHDSSQIDESEFRYAGPKPHSKESGIIMIADSLEAASRSLEQINEQALTDLVNRLVKEKVEDGQFDDCLLTFEEMAIVKTTLVRTLLAFMHARVKYPTRDIKRDEVAFFENNRKKYIKDDG